MNPVEYVTVKRELIEQLPTLTHETLKVFLVLLDRNTQQAGTKIGLSLNELARTADIGRINARNALSFLAQNEYVTLVKKGKHYVITVSAYWLGENPVPIPFTYDDTDATKISRAEAEIRRLEADAKRRGLGERSGLTDVLRGEERDLIQEIEVRRGQSLSPGEAYFVGKAVARFNPDRVKSTWRRLQSSKNPIRATYAALMNGAKGKAAQPVESEPFKKVKYRDVD